MRAKPITQQLLELLPGTNNVSLLLIFHWLPSKCGSVLRSQSRDEEAKTFSEWH